ncbi:MAG: lysylphosphatidylglycerol synthase transmembrane domain-containing protein [Dermatophilus congolensis]|nr:lysylphosphatidylglycerol synthase transmembrane domain-containing protein [Dermatophilus congolensis]
MTERRSSKNPLDVELPSDAKEIAWRVLQGLLSLGLAAGLLGWFLPKITHTTWGEIWGTVTGIGWPTFFGLLALMFTGLYCYTFTLMGSLPGLTHARALMSNLAGSGISNTLPAGGAFGTALNYAMWRSWGFTHTQITSSVIVTTVWNVLARALLPVLAALILLPFPEKLPGAMWTGAIAGGLAGVVAVGSLGAILTSKTSAARIGALGNRILTKLRPSTSIDAEKAALRLRAQMIDIVSARWGHLTFGLAGFFGVYFLLFAACLHVAGVDVSWRMMFAAFAVGRLLTAVPLTPGGLGVAEAGSAAVLVAMGAAPAPTGAAVTLFALYSHLLEIPAGAVAAGLWIATRPSSGGE